MGAYKFCTPEVARIIVETGSIRVSRLSFFERLEIEEQRAGIGDRLERKSGFRVDHLEVTDRDEHAHARQMLAPWIGVGEGATVVLEDCHLTTVCEDVYVFCYSIGDYEEMKDAMAARHPELSATIEILAPDLLAHRVRYRGIVQQLNGSPVRHIIMGSEAKPVEYGPVLVPFQQGPPVRRPLPFFKDTFFDYQNEARLVLWPRPQTEHLPDRLDVKIPKPSELFSRVD